MDEKWGMELLTNFPSNKNIFKNDKKNYDLEWDQAKTKTDPNKQIPKCKFMIMYAASI